MTTLGGWPRVITETGDAATYHYDAVGNMTFSATDLYLMGQTALLAALLPYSAWVLFFVGTMLLGTAIMYRRPLLSRYRFLPTIAKTAIILMLLFEAIPAVLMGMVICVVFGFDFGSRVGKSLTTLGGLFGGPLENVGHGIGAIVGSTWAFIAGIVTMETVAGLLGGTVACIATWGIGILRGKGTHRLLVPGI